MRGRRRLRRKGKFSPARSAFCAERRAELECETVCCSAQEATLVVVSLGRFTTSVYDLRRTQMMKSIFSAWQHRLEKRRRYLRLIAEIESLNARDLQELRADPLQMRQDAWRSIYG
jgi:hypothetical protein